VLLYVLISRLDLFLSPGAHLYHWDRAEGTSH